MTRSASRFEQRLGELACFAGLNHRELMVVAGLVDEIEVPPGRPFGGHPSREVLIVEHGAAIEGGVAFLGPSAVVGPSGATALNRVRLLVIGRRALPALLDLAPRLAQALRGGSEPTSRPPQPRRAGPVVAPSRPRVTELPGPREPS
jgi:hypothetical protein